MVREAKFDEGVMLFTPMAKLCAVTMTLSHYVPYAQASCMAMLTQLDSLRG